MEGGGAYSAGMGLLRSDLHEDQPMWCDQEASERMTTYGYRMFGLELRRGLGQKPQPFESCGGQRYIDLMPKLFGRLGTTRVGKPIFKNMAPAADDRIGGRLVASRCSGSTD